MNVSALLQPSGVRPRWYSVLGVLLLPVLVAGGFLWATWNTDARLHKVEAAVVNLDEAVTIDGQMVPLGRQLSAALVDEERQQNFKWVLADAKGAESGLKAGRYAAVVTIPKNFSAAATSYAGDVAEAKQATIQVETSQITGVADTALGQAVAQAAVDTLNETLTKSYIENVYVGFGEMGKQFSTVADGARQLADGATKLSDGLGEAASGSRQLSDGLAEAAGSNDKLTDGGGQLVSGSGELTSGTEQLSDGVGQYVKGVGSVISGTQTQLDSIPGMRQLFGGASGYVSGAGALSGTTASALTALIDQSTIDIDGVPYPVSTSADVRALKASMANSYRPYVFAVLQATGQTFPYCTQLSLGWTDCNNAAAYSLTTTPDPADPAAGIGQDGTIYAILSAAAGISQGMVPVTSPAPNDLGKLLLGLQQAEAVLPTDTQIATQRAGLTQLDDAGDQIRVGIAELAAGSDKFTEGLQSYVDGVAKYTDGIAQAATGSQELTDGLDQLGDGARQLADGTTKLADGLQQGAKEVPSYTESQRETLGKVVAAPISKEGLDSLVLPTISWATLLLVIGLWLGAMAVYLVLHAIRPRLVLSSLPTWRLVAGALLPGVGLVGIQALALAGIGQVAMGLPVEKFLQVTGVLLAAAAAFALVNHALVAWLKGAGRLVAVLFATITAIAATTYALPGFFDALRPFSPLTPALDAIRSIATDGTSTSGSVFKLLGWLVIGLVASAVAVMRARRLRPVAVVTE